LAANASLSLSSAKAKRFGVTEVPAEAVNYISHATQARLRSVLEKVSTIAQHRTDGGKVRTGRVEVIMNRSG
jgi:hypothetical protein